MEFIDLKAQYDRYKSDIDARIQAVVNHSRFIMGPEIAEVEEQLARYVGVSHCITTSSGTHSIEIAFRALGVGPGDEVITVPFTWISCAETISLVGAKSVFVDIDASSYTMDVELLEKAITERTKAILPVSLYGQMPDYGAINQIADRHGIAVIEDAAQSFGATQHGQPSCSVTRIASTSFFPAKPLGCFGDGGALFTNDDELADCMRAIRSHGGRKRYHHTMVGTNGRLDTLQAAVLLAKLPHLQNEIEARQRIGARDTSLLKDQCKTPEVIDGNTHVYAQYTIRLNDRDAVSGRMKDEGIPTAVYYPKCLHQQPIYHSLGYCAGDFPESEKASREVLSLPMHAFLKEEAQDTVVNSLLKNLE